jgi:hypothetical protein
MLKVSAAPPILTMAMTGSAISAKKHQHALNEVGPADGQKAAQKGVGDDTRMRR